MPSLSDRVRGFSKSPVGRLKKIGKEMQDNGRDVVFLSQGQPDFPTPKHIKDAACNALEEGYTSYISSEGLPELREEVARKLKEHNNISRVTEDEVLITTGAYLGLFLSMLATLEKEDEVLAFEPFFGPYPDIVKSTGGRFLSLRLKNGDLNRSKEKINDSISERTKIILINNPQNPSGKVWTREDLELIAQLAERNDCYIVSDEVYEKIIYDDVNHYSIASLSPEIKRRTISIFSFSKTYAMTGWRLGYLSANSKLVDAMSNLCHVSARCATSFVQKAGLVAIRESQECISKMVTEYRKRRNFTLKHLKRIEGVEVRNVEGTFYAFPNISYFGQSSNKLAEKLLKEAGVVVSPGSYYGDDERIRISFAASKDQIAEGLNRIREYLKNLDSKR